MKKKMLVSLLFLVLVSSVTVLTVKALVIEKYVNDFAGVLDRNCIIDLNNIAHQIELNTTAEIAILTVNTTNGETAFDYSLAVARDNGIGKESKNNGMLIFVTMQERQYFIQNGYGLEGILPDSRLSEIRDENFVPYLKSGDYCMAFKKTLSAIGSVLENDSEVSPETTAISLPDIPFWLVIIALGSVFLFGLVLTSPFGRNNNDTYSLTDDKGHDYEVTHRERCPKCGSIMKKDREENEYIIYKCKKCGEEKRRRAVEKEDRLIPFIITDGGHSHSDDGDSDSSSGGFGGFGGGGFGGGGVGGGF